MQGFASSFLFSKYRSKGTLLLFITFDSLIVFMQAMPFGDQIAMWFYGVWSTSICQELCWVHLLNRGCQFLPVLGHALIANISGLAGLVSGRPQPAARRTGQRRRGKARQKRAQKPKELFLKVRLYPPLPYKITLGSLPCSQFSWCTLRGSEAASAGPFQQRCHAEL